MKRILIALAVLLSVQVADAQTKTPEAAKKALVSAEAASQDAKKAAKENTEHLHGIVFSHFGLNLNNLAENPR